MWLLYTKNCASGRWQYALRRWRVVRTLCLQVVPGASAAAGAVQARLLCAVARLLPGAPHAAPDAVEAVIQAMQNAMHLPQVPPNPDTAPQLERAPVRRIG